MNPQRGGFNQSPGRKRGHDDLGAPPTPPKRLAGNMPSGGVFDDPEFAIGQITPYVNK